jgi:hypothetical protein
LWLEAFDLGNLFARYEFASDFDLFLELWAASNHGLDRVSHCKENKELEHFIQK